MSPNAKRSSSLPRRAARTLAFLAVQGLSILLVLELGLHWATPRHESLHRLLYRPEAATHYDDVDSLEELMGKSMLGFNPRQIYYGFALNSRSLRTTEYQQRKAPGTMRMLAFGDSFTFASGGLPSHLHWPVVLEEELGRRHGGPAEVLRLGVPGTGPQFQFRLWQVEGRRLGADVVIHAFFVGNDFLDEQGAYGFWGLAEVFRQSYALRLGDRLPRLREAFGPTSREAGERGGHEISGYRHSFDPERPSFSRSAFLEIEARRLGLLRRDRTARFERSMRSVKETLRAFAAEVARQGGRYVLMIIPDEFQVDAEVRRETLEFMGHELEDLDLELPQRRLGEFATANGIEFLDLLPVFREEGRTRALYRIRDTHWNEAGNRLAARLLADRLMKEAAAIPIFKDGFETGDGRAWSLGEE